MIRIEGVPVVAERLQKALRPALQRVRARAPRSRPRQPAVKSRAA